VREKYEEKAGEQGMHEVRKEIYLKRPSPVKVNCSQFIEHQLKRKRAELSDHRTTREELLSQGMATDDPTIVAMNRRIGELFEMVTCYNRELDEISEEHLKDLREKEKQDRKRRQERASRELNDPLL
jgi:hypothetical protein